MEHSIHMAIFDGTIVQVPLDDLECIKNDARHNILNFQQSGMSDSDIGQNALATLRKQKKKLCRDFPEDYDYTTLMKKWGKDEASMWMLRWAVAVKIAVNMGVLIPDGKTNGLITIETGDEGIEILKSLKVVVKTKKSIFKTCVVCAKSEFCKTCSGCKKDYYCGAECQKADWKRHKAQHHA
jgi:hypothetical protein